jgi:hypothetical protein
VANGNITSFCKLTQRQYSALAALVVLLASFLIVPGALAQTDPAPPGTVSQGDPNAGGLSQGAAATQATVPSPYYNANGYTNLVQQQAEQNTPAVAQNVEQQLWPDFGAYNDTYDGLSAFWGDDIVSNLFSNIGQLIGKWLSEFINGWVADTVQFLTGFLRVFVLNPNIAVNGLNGNGQADDISPYIRQGADIMYGIAVDLLLLLFVLCIWRFWAEAAWRGGGNLMGAVGRLIFTAGLMLAWPTIYAFEIQISNEMIKAIYFNSADQVAMLDAAMAAAVKGGLVAGAGLLANATAPIAGQVFGGALGVAGGAGGPIGMTLGMVGGLVAFVGLIVYLVLGGILIAELIYILVLKSIQTALLCAQYMFAPLFLVFMATPDTEQVCSGFVRSFVEVSLWTFVWVGLLKIMVIIVLSNFNPWGKIVMTVGVLQLMIQVPSFLARAQISPMSDFISAGLVTGGLLKGGSALANVLSNRSQQFANAIGNFGYAGAKGAPKSQTTELNGLANDVARPDLLKDIRNASATGQVPGEKKKPGEGGPENPGGMPLNPVDPNAPKGPKGSKEEEDAAKKAGEQPPAKPLTPAGAEGQKGDKSAVGTPDSKLNPSGAPGTPEGAKGDKNNPTVGDALANGARNGALGAMAGVAAGAGLAAVESGAALKQAGAGGNNAEEQKNATAAQQQAAEAMKKLEGLNNAGAGLDGKEKLGPDGKPIVPAGGDGKTTKIQGGTLPAGPDGGKGKDAAGNAVSAVPLPDATVTGTVKGKGDANKTTGPGATDANAKGKDLAAGVGAADLKTPTTTPPTQDGADKNKQGVGEQLEMEFDRGEDKAVAAVTVAGLSGAAKLTDLKDAGDGKGGPTGDKGATGGKQVVSGGKLDGTGTNVNAATGATTDLSAKILPKKPGETVNGKTVAPSVSTANLHGAVSSSGTGKNIDPTTGAGTTDVVHDDKDPGAPITSPVTKTEVHSLNSAQQLTGATGAKGEVTGKVVATNTPPAAGNAAGQQVNLPTGTATVTGNRVNTPEQKTPVVTPGQVTSTTQGGGKGLEQAAGIVANEIVQEEMAQGAANAAGITGVRTEVRTNTGVTPPTNNQNVQTSATGKIVTGVGGNQTAPPITQVASQFTQASAGKGPAPIANAVGPVPGGGGAAGGGGGGGPTPPPPPPPPFDESGSNELGSGSNPGPPSVEAGMGSQPVSNRTQGSMYDGYMQSGYRHVPYRVAAAAIRLAQGATLAPSRSGKPEVIQDNQGHVMHYRFGEGATDEQKAMQIMSGAYGELMSTDAEAYDAARISAIDAGEHKPKGLAQNIAAGILAYNGSSWTQTAAAKQNFQRSMAKHATLGAQSYVAGEAGNAYTEYLTNRYGPMSDEQQAWGVNIMTDASSPESGWSWRMGPATDALIQNGLPISPVHRAVAANPSVLKAQPWLRGAAIRGGVQYMQARAEQTLPEGTNGLVQDAWYGNQAQAMAPEVVNTVGAITLALGEKACSDTATIDKVAAMIGPQGKPEDAVGAYNALKGGNTVMARMQQRFSGPTGGGGGGGFNMGNTTVNAGPMPNGPSDMGPVQTSVSGSIIGGGVGGARNNAEVDMVFGPSNQGPANLNPNSIVPPSINPQMFSQSGGATQANFRVVGGGSQQSGGGGNQNFTMRMPGQNVGSTNEQIVTGHVSSDNSSRGGGNAPDRVVGVDVMQDVNQHMSSAPASSGDMHQAFAGALQQHGGSDNMVQRVIADLRSTGMQWNQIFDPSKQDSDPGKYQLLQTAMECESRDIPVTTVAIAARAMGAGNVTSQHVDIVQNMLDADPHWSPQNISYSDVYTAQALVEAHRVDPGLYGNPYLSKDYVDTVKADPRFTPRPVPMRNPVGQIVDYARSKVPEDLLMRKTQQGYGAAPQGGRSRGGGGGGGGRFGGGSSFGGGGGSPSGGGFDDEGNFV